VGGVQLPETIVNWQLQMADFSMTSSGGFLNVAANIKMPLAPLGDKI
jgi:hypothetical protein